MNTDTIYGRICNIILRKSLSDLQRFLEKDNLNQLRKGNSITPLHFAAAASWPAGVELLILHGHDRFQQDSHGECPVDIAVDAGCISALELLLAEDCLEFLNRRRRYQTTTLPYSFMEAVKSDKILFHDMIIQCLSRHRHKLPELRPYHDLARERDDASVLFAQKLFAAGFQEIETYNEEGYTPLMAACIFGNISMASFLLQHGAEPYKCHKHVGLRAGHFLTYNPGWLGFLSGCVSTREDSLRPKDTEKEILQAAFNPSIDVRSYCRCSPAGFSPITSIFRLWEVADFYKRKESFKILMRNLDCTPSDMKRHWHSLVVSELFNRLEMTHTCVRILPKVRLFDDIERMRIEAEEEELLFQLQELVARFELLSVTFDGSDSDCVDEFFDDLDNDLPPPQHFSFTLAMWTANDPDCFGPGVDVYPDSWISSRGREIMYGYKEIGTESSMLRLLF